MATILQTQLLTFLTPMFVFLLVFVVLYALLQKYAFFGGVKGFDAVIAFAVSMLVLLMPETTQVITLFTPWVVLLGFLTLVIFVFFMFLGVSGETMASVAKEGTFITTVVVLILVLFLVALSQTIGPILLTNQEAGFWNATKRVIFHPRMLGALFILVVSAYAVKFIATNQ